MDPEPENVSKVCVAVNCVVLAVTLYSRYVQVRSGAAGRYTSPNAEALSFNRSRHK